MGVAFLVIAHIIGYSVHFVLCRIVWLATNKVLADLPSALHVSLPPRTSLPLYCPSFLLPLVLPFLFLFLPFPYRRLHSTYLAPWCAHARLSFLLEPSRTIWPGLGIIVCSIFHPLMFPEPPDPVHLSISHRAQSITAYQMGDPAGNQGHYPHPNASGTPAWGMPSRPPQQPQHIVQDIPTVAGTPVPGYGGEGQGGRTLRLQRSAELVRGGEGGAVAIGAGGGATGVNDREGQGVGHYPPPLGNPPGAVV